MRTARKVTGIRGVACIAAAVASTLCGTSDAAAADAGVAPRAAAHTAFTSIPKDLLLTALQEGIASALPDQTTERTRFDRLEQYSAMIEELARRNELDAVRLLKRIAAGDLPSAIHEDLELGAAVHPVEPFVSWEAFAYERAVRWLRLRCDCAMALAYIGDQSALPVALRLLDGTTGAVGWETQRPRIDPRVQAAFVDTCAAVASLGDRRGIDAAVARLDLLETRAAYRGEAGSGLVPVLQAGTRQPIGPAPFPCEDERREGVVRWLRWWSAHRGEYNMLGMPLIDAPGFPYSIAVETPGLRAETVRSALALLSMPAFEGAEARRSAARVWLQDRLRHIGPSLRAIALDPGEHPRIRRTAAEWWSQSADPNAAEVLLAVARRQCAGETQYLDDEPVVPALALLLRRFPTFADEAMELAQTAALDGRTWAMRQVLPMPHQTQERRRREIEFLCAHHERLAELHPTMRHEIAWAVRDEDSAEARDILRAALMSDDRLAAAAAACSLPIGNRSAMEPPGLAERWSEWERDPLFLLECAALARAMGADHPYPIERAVATAQALAGGDLLQRAQTHARACEVLLAVPRADLTTLLVASADALRECIAARFSEPQIVAEGAPEDPADGTESRPDSEREAV